MPKPRLGGALPTAATTILAALLLGGCGSDSYRDETAMPAPRAVLVQADSTAHLYRSPSCECCGEHGDYLADSGFEVVEHSVEDMSGVKRQLGVPEALSSCHTTVIGGYVVEGHVPTADIDRLLAEQPEVDGIALGGMPPGSPGMPGELEGPLDVRAFADGVDAGPVR